MEIVVYTCNFLFDIELPSHLRYKSKIKSDAFTLDSKLREIYIISIEWHQYGDQTIVQYFIVHISSVAFKIRVALRRCVAFIWNEYRTNVIAQISQRMDEWADHDRAIPRLFTTYSLRVYWFSCLTRQQRRLRWPTTTFTRTFFFCIY